MSDGFGKNWAAFIDASFSTERRNIARHRLLNFMNVIRTMKQTHGFTLVNIATGEACSEFLFARDGASSGAAV